MIQRDISHKLITFSQEFASVALLGPRQSGKTTIAKATFPNYLYFSFEDIALRRLVAEDPQAFLNQHTNSPGIILDEIQHVPELFSYMQLHIDQFKKKGHFIVTGSENFSLNQAITQSLAGRIAIMTLLPLSIHEMSNAEVLPETIEKIIFKGCYPSLYNEQRTIQAWYANYITTYIERDVRQIKNITDLTLFQNFMKLIAGRTGQTLNLTSLSNDIGISLTTVRNWLTILEASYIIFLLPPYYRNWGKRLVKMPKLYFYDTGLACNLLSIANEEQLASHYLKGSLFESLIISDLIKQRLNNAYPSNVYYWRDKIGSEIDAILEQSNKLIPVEIKAAQTFTPHFFDRFSSWNTLTDTDPENNTLIYGGDLSQKTKRGTLVSWKNASIINKTF